MYYFRSEGISFRKKPLEAVAMDTWLELSICNLIFSSLPLANISLSLSLCPPPPPPISPSSLSHTRTINSSVLTLKIFRLFLGGRCLEGYCKNLPESEVFLHHTFSVMICFTR